MTRDQFEAAGRSLFGPQWQTPLSASLGVNVRTVQRWVSGAVAVPAGAAEDIAALAAHDEWIVGDGALSRHEFIVHTKWPRFVARIVADDDPRDADAPLSPLVLALDIATDLREIVWYDPPPDSAAELGELAGRALAALTAIALDDEARADSLD